MDAAASARFDPGVRLLHVIDPWTDVSGGSPSADAGLLGAHAAMTALPEAQHASLLIGSGALERSAHATGIPGVDRVAISAASHALGRPIARVLSARGVPDLVLAWGERGARSMRTPLRGRAPLVRMDLGVAGARRWRRHVGFCESPGTGAASRRVTLAPFAPSPTDDQVRSSRARLREALDLDDDRLMIALVDPCPDPQSATRFVFLTTMMWAVGLRVGGLMVRTPTPASRARVLHRRSGARAPIVVVDTPLSAAIPACDVGVVIDGPGARAGLGAIGMLVAHAHAWGVPVLAPPSRRGESWYGPGVACACVTASAKLRDLGGPLRAMLSDRTYRGDAASACREHSRTCVREFRVSMRALIESWTGSGAALGGPPLRA